MKLKTLLIDLVRLAMLCTAGASALRAQPASSVIIQADCSISQKFIAIGNKQYDNRAGTCTKWNLSYYSTGFTGLTVTVETAPDNNGVPGSWSTFTAATGSNPNTSTTSTQATFSGYFPWLRVRVSGLTGSGTIQTAFYGYKVSAFASSGGGGSSFYQTIQASGTAQPQEAAFNFTGSGVTVTDDSGNSRTTINIPGGGGGGGNTIPSVAISAPVLASYTIVNGGSLTSSNTVVGGIALTQGASAAVNYAFLVKNRAFTAPYTVEVGFFTEFSINSFLTCGGLVYNSGSTSAIMAQSITGGSYDFSARIEALASPTSETGRLDSTFYFLPQGEPIFCKLIDDGSGVVKVYLSLDWGRRYFLVATSGAFTFDKVGFGIGSNFSSVSAMCTFFHLAEYNTATP